jgi:hypothetical protein
VKKCTKCLEEKALSEFWKHKNYKDGLRPHCKNCLKQANKEYYLNNIDKLKEANKKHYEQNREKYLTRSKCWRLENPLKCKEQNYRYYNQMNQEQKEKALERKRIYDKTDKGKLKSKTYRQGKKWIARYTFRNAIRDGKIKKETICQLCLSDKWVEGHHADYDKPLIVVWVCRKCHAAIHKKIKKEAICK